MKAISLLFQGEVGAILLKIALFVLVVLVIAAALTTVDSTLRGLAGTVALQVPDLGYWYYMFIPDNLTSTISLYFTAETALAVYHWVFWFVNRKVSIPV